MQRAAAAMVVASSETMPETMSETVSSVAVVAMPAKRLCRPHRKRAWRADRRCLLRLCSNTQIEVVLSARTARWFVVPLTTVNPILLVSEHAKHLTFESRSQTSRGSVVV